MSFFRRIHNPIFIFLWLVPGLVFGSDDAVVVVLTSDLKPYQEAAAGFRLEYGRDVPSFTLTGAEPKIPAGTRVVVAVGGKAALALYPNGARLVYCLAPGLLVPPETRREKPVKIFTAPSLFVIVSKLKEIQPSLKRLAIPWISDSIGEYLSDRREIAARLDVDIIPERLQSTADLPDYLRGLAGKADGLWLPPDPQIISATNLPIIQDFSQANRLPFYTPTDGLTEKGAVASVSSSFAEIGKTAARVAAGALEGTWSETVVFPKKTQTTINLKAAKAVGLTLPDQAVRSADRVIE